MLTSYNIQWILSNHHCPFPCPLTYTWITFPQFAGHPHSNVHSVHLVHGLGFICCNDHSEQEVWCVMLDCWVSKPAQIGSLLHLPSSLWGSSSIGLDSSCCGIFNIQLWHHTAITSCNLNHGLFSPKDKSSWGTPQISPIFCNYPPNAPRFLSKSNPISLPFSEEGITCSLSQTVPTICNQEALVVVILLLVHHHGSNQHLLIFDT